MTSFRLIILSFVALLATSVAGASSALQSSSSGSGVPVQTISPTAVTGFDVTLASNSYNYTLYTGNPSIWGNLQQGGYVEYTVFASVAGTYALQVYYSTAVQGAGANIIVNGMQQAAFNLANTGSWGTMVLSPPQNITLPSGQSVIQIASSSQYDAYNLAGLLTVPVAASQTTTTSTAPAPAPTPTPAPAPAPAPAPTPTPTPTTTSPAPAPTVASGSVKSVSSSGVTGFDIALASNSANYTLYPGSPALWGNLQPTGFVEYTVSASAGNYALQLYYATAIAGGANILVNGVQQAAASFPNTGSWNNFTMSSPITIALPSGQSVIRIAAQMPFSPYNLEGMTLAPASGVVQAAPTPTPAPITTTSSGTGGNATNPLAGTSFYVNPYSEAGMNSSVSCSSYYPGSTGLIAKIANQPQGVWFGDWNTNIQSDAAGVVNAASALKTVPIMVAYNIPVRDCSGYSGGGASSAGAYQTWIQGMAAGIGNAKAVVVLEPDALTQLYQTGCLTTTQQTERLSLLNYAVNTLHQTAPQALVYIDSGDAGAFAPSDIAQRLQAAGVANAAGFSLNVSNYLATDVTTNYGNQISSLLGNKHFVIDTSRNGLGDTPDNQWCNPPNRGLGAPSQGFGSGPLDAYLWVQNPGTSDGTCNGGPPAGTFSPQIACTLAHNAIF